MYPTLKQLQKKKAKPRPREGQGREQREQQKHHRQTQQNQLQPQNTPIQNKRTGQKLRPQSPLSPETQLHFTQLIDDNQQMENEHRLVPFSSSFSAPTTILSGNNDVRSEYQNDHDFEDDDQYDVNNHSPFDSDTESSHLSSS